MLSSIPVALQWHWIRVGRPALLTAIVAVAVVSGGTAADAQVVVYGAPQPVTAYYAPMAAGYPGGYMANYSPAGNYAAVTAFSPPVYSQPMATAYVANYAVESVASPVSVTSYYAPAPAYSAPVYAAPAYAAPVTTYYAPAAVAVPLYRRGLFGGLRPARTAMYIPY
jgi:hypothetical protein